MEYTTLGQMNYMFLAKDESHTNSLSTNQEKTNYSVLGMSGPLFNFVLADEFFKVK